MKCFFLKFVFFCFLKAHAFSKRILSAFSVIICLLFDSRGKITIFYWNARVYTDYFCVFFDRKRVISHFLQTIYCIYEIFVVPLPRN